jgi:hypothetical protein
VVTNIEQGKRKDLDVADTQSLAQQLEPEAVAPSGLARSKTEHGEVSDCGVSGASQQTFLAVQPDQPSGVTQLSHIPSFELVGSNLDDTLFDPSTAKDDVLFGPEKLDDTKKNQKANADPKSHAPHDSGEYGEWSDKHDDIESTPPPESYFGGGGGGGSGIYWIGYSEPRRGYLCATGLSRSCLCSRCSRMGDLENRMSTMELRDRIYPGGKHPPVLPREGTNIRTP